MRKVALSPLPRQRLVGQRISLTKTSILVTSLIPPKILESLTVISTKISRQEHFFLLIYQAKLCCDGKSFICGSCHPRFWSCRSILSFTPLWSCLLSVHSFLLEDKLLTNLLSISGGFFIPTCTFVHNLIYTKHALIGQMLEMLYVKFELPSGYHAKVKR